MYSDKRIIRLNCLWRHYDRKYARIWFISECHREECWWQKWWTPTQLIVKCVCVFLARWNSNFWSQIGVEIGKIESAVAKKAKTTRNGIYVLLWKIFANSKNVHHLNYLIALASLLKALWSLLVTLQIFLDNVQGFYKSFLHWYDI